MSVRRIAIAAALALLFVCGSATAASALWTASGTTGSSATLGKVVGGIAGTDKMTVTFSSSTTSTTYPLTLTNAGNIPGTYATSVAVTQGVTLAQNVSVVAWPVSTAGDCVASASVGTGSVSGTWAAAPSLTGTLAATKSAVWCLRTTPTSSAPASATTNLVISLVVSNGNWRSLAVVGGFYLNTSAAAAATPASQCLDYDGNYHVRISWDATTRALETYYSLVVAGTQVNSPAQGYTGYIDLAGSDVPASVAADGPARVDVAVLNSDGTPTGQIASTGSVTFGASQGARTVVCGG